MNAAPSMLSTCGLKRSTTAAIDRSLPWTVFTVMPLTAGSCRSAAFAGGAAVGELVFAGQVQLVDRRETPRRLRRRARRCGRTRRAPRRRAGAHGRSCRRRRGSARDRSGFRPALRAPGGRGHHPDAGDSTSTSWPACAIAASAWRPRSATSRGGAPTTGATSIERRGDDQDPHRSASDARRSRFDVLRSNGVIRRIRRRRQGLVDDVRLRHALDDDRQAESDEHGRRGETEIDADADDGRGCGAVSGVFSTMANACDDGQRALAGGARHESATTGT